MAAFYAAFSIVRLGIQPPRVVQGGSSPDGRFSLWDSPPTALRIDNQFAIMEIPQTPTVIGDWGPKLEMIPHKNQMLDTVNQ